MEFLGVAQLKQYLIAKKTKYYDVYTLIECINDAIASTSAIKPVTRFPTNFWINTQPSMGIIWHV
jgi:hypothetical protein